MKSSKLGTLFLCMLLVFTLLVAVGCGKDDETKPEETKAPTSTEKPTNNNGNGKTNNSSNTTNTVKLLKRNGVEWKENKKINSKVGAKSYKVVWGDTLRLIAKTWHVNTLKLARYNNLKNPDLIEVDQIIYNPAYKKK